MNDGNTVAGYIPFDPILSDAPKENEPMNPTDMNEVEMREFFAKVASAVVNASEQAKVIEAIRAQQVEDHARLHNLESLVTTHLQTIDALREAVRVTAEERDNWARDFREVTVKLRDERDVAEMETALLREQKEEYTTKMTERGTLIHEHETTIHELRTRVAELEAAAKGAQQTIVNLQNTIYNAREELRHANANYENEHHAHVETLTTLDTANGMIAHYETQLDQVRKAIS